MLEIMIKDAWIDAYKLAFHMKLVHILRILKLRVHDLSKAKHI